MASIELETPLASHLETPISKDGVTVTEIENETSQTSSSSSSSSRHGGGQTDDFFYPHPTDFKPTEAPIDEVRALKVAVIGAGLTGITAGALLPAKVPGIDLTIFEKNADVGGTWYENVYPGVRCDIPAHVYQSTFSPNTQWSEEYAQGAEIRDYWQSVARKYDVYSNIRFNTKVLGAYWEPEQAKWRLEIEKGGEQSTTHFDFLITAIGHFNQWKLPSWPGIDKYKGKLMHSSAWDPSFDPSGKRIATIGNGASGIQVTTEVRKTAAHVDHYARSRTWIAGSFNPDSKERQDVPMHIDQEQRRTFASDPKAYLKYRKDLEDTFWRAFAAQIADSDVSRDSREKFIELMRKRLGDEQESLLDKLVPDFPPHCRRLTPGPGYLEALSKPNLEFIQTPIKEFTEDGIVTIDGVHRPAEAVICSTGANTDFAPPFPIVSGSYDLSRDWKPNGAFGFPYTYISMCTPHFPNLSFLLGPNSAGPSGTVPHAVETMVTYIAKQLRKMSSQGIRTMTPSVAAADDFIAYCDAFFPRTNLARNCSSWSNGGRPGARIHGHWPGSAAHLAQVRREPRWEDYEYTYLRPENRFSFLGNGWTKREMDKGRDMTPYLKLEGENDLRDLHERWWDL